MNLGSVWDKLEPEERKFLHYIILLLQDKGYYKTAIPINVSYERIIFLDLDVITELFEDYVTMTSTKNYILGSKIIDMKDLLIKLGKSEERFDYIE